MTDAVATTQGPTDGTTDGTTDERPQGPQGPHGPLWLLIASAALALVLLAVAYVQWRQYELLDNATHYQNDALGWSFSQLETEQLRLRNQMQTSLQAGANPPDREALQLRYDIFVSRIGLIDHERAARIMSDQRSYAPAIKLVRAFVADADRVLGEKPTEPLTPQALKQLLDNLDTLTVPLHDLSLGASHLLYERATQRNSAVRQQSVLSLALTLSQCVLLLVLTVIVLTQLRTLNERRKNLEALADNLHAARIEAEKANRAKSVFLANMSHEIRTPFHGLLGMMSLLQDTGLNAQQQGFLLTAKESANHLLAILNDILDISQLESGKLQVQPETMELPLLIAQVEALMRVQAQSKGLALNVQLEPDVPRWVRADATRLKQILFNLLSNAVKFSEAGSVGLRVASGFGGRIIFSVSDTGVGMDGKTLERLFQRFMRADDSPSRRQGGTGLGLEISRDLARLMGGDITVQSEIGRGSVFTVALPLQAAAAPTPAQITPESVATARTPGPLRVLVAEDHPVNRAYLEAVLDKLGHQAVFKEDGDGAVRAMQQHEFDVVLMDLHMPGMDGFAAARAIRSMPPPRGRVPIIALTADAFQASRDLARQAGMDGFLTKPAHLPQLREALERHSGIGKTAPATAVAAASASTAPSQEPHPPDETFDPATVVDARQALSPLVYADLLARFFSGQPEALTTLRGAARSANHAALHAQAHALKGAALNLGLRAVADAAQLLQSATAAGEANGHIDTLEHALARSRAHCIRDGLLPG
jgi:signal transduction histidine kinase/DNA-binding NarL/FixJ family response regulator/HPt (histidine-containing phosphotransfer) domain-containing protein